MQNCYSIDWEMYSICLFLFVWAVSGQEPCLLNLSGDKSPLFRPFIFTDDGNFFPTQNNIVKISNGRSAIFSCENNYFREHLKQSNLTVSCRDDDLYLKDKAEPVTFKDLSCDLRIIEEVGHTVLDCPMKYKGISYQFFDTRTGLYTHLAEACYDNDLLRNVFTHFKASKNIEAIEHSNHDDSTLQSNTDIRHRISILSTYRPNKIKTLFDRILGEDFSLGGLSLEPVKLPPRVFFNDQLQDIQKFPTNYIGVWNSIIHGNWKRITNDIKEYSRSHNLDVYIGTHDVLKVPSENGLHVELFLDAGKYPVPKFVWTVVQEKSTQSSVAIITVNKPFIPLSELNDIVFCNDICAQIKWLNSLLKNKNNEVPLHGYTFCCAIDSFPYLQSVKTATKKVLK